MKADSKKSLLGMLGLCRRAGAMICGSDLVCAELSSKRPPYLVIVASGASEASRSKLTGKCFHYGIECLTLPFTTDELGHAIGKSGSIAAVAIVDERFSARIKELASALN